ncbi:MULTISPECIES: hypothetical protein [Cryobacterium]|uniref:Uncharacterized protein n=1 Tax=Cryobacterium breve TaxID=1259258 RepID=A0ABY2J3F7_9MICO|nr:MULTISPECIES: hypothetical protein [Cryobacterium]TFC91717.1 hypothetical protein E3T20_12685 [Cryobacterium sp. TmT3-12]TFC98266.1 hypothetical protein E3O65_07905 [Cryobacterium breve]
MSSESPHEPQPGEPVSGKPVNGESVPGEPVKGESVPGMAARRARRRPTLLELSIWFGVAGTGIYAIGTGIAGMLDK